MRRLLARHGAAAALCALLVSGCSSDSNSNRNFQPAPDPATPARLHDQRSFTPVLPSEETLAALELEGATLYSGLHEGEHGHASYLIQVPDNWNGVLVMYAHGYRGEEEALTVQPPVIYQQLIDHGYAWAASSYSANYYDVRAGIEDTNALALAFEALTRDVQGNSPGSPSKYYIIGHSMGGHIAGAAVEAETLATANNVVEYAGAVPMCGVMGDTELFDYFAAYNLAAQELAGIDIEVTAENYVEEVLPRITDALWIGYGNAPGGSTGVPTEAGMHLLNILERLSGGARPTYVLSSQVRAWHDLLLGFGVPNGNVSGILASNVVDTTDIQYRWSDGAITADERAFNQAVERYSPTPGANAPRPDGLRWIPQVNGEFSVPVVTLHTLGDLFVPFEMQRIYARRAEENGSDQWLVQRAIRAGEHCDFTADEEWEAFTDMVAWELNGQRPDGDEVLDPSIVAASDYGCAFTRENRFPDVAALACPAP